MDRARRKSILWRVTGAVVVVSVVACSLLAITFKGNNAESRAALRDVPLYAGAFWVQLIDGYTGYRYSPTGARYWRGVVYSVPGNQSDILKFYRDWFGRQGWTEVNSAPTTRTNIAQENSYWLLRFEKVYAHVEMESRTIPIGDWLKLPVWWPATYSQTDRMSVWAVPGEQGATGVRIVLDAR